MSSLTYQRYGRPTPNRFNRFIDTTFSWLKGLALAALILGILSLPVIWYGGIAYIVIHFLAKVW